MVVSAFQEASAATGVDGDQSDNSAPEAGAAYVFVRSGTTWSQQAYLKASNSDAGDWFGNAVALDGDTLVAGARYERSAATGIDGDQSDDSLHQAGAAYVFTRSGSSWSQDAYLKASNTASGYSFGAAAAVCGDTIVLGSTLEHGGSSGVNGSQQPSPAFESGAGYVFVRVGEAWSQQAYLKASNTEQLDWFGGAVAVSGDTVVVGAVSEDSGATGVDGDQDDNGAAFAGAAYVFERCPGLVPATESVRLGSPPNPAAFLPGRTYTPLLSALWDPVIDHGTFLPDALLDFVGISIAPINLPLPPLGTLLCDPGSSLAQLAGVPGQPFEVLLPDDCAFLGVSLCSQGASLDPLGAIHLTNALDLTIGSY